MPVLHLIKLRAPPPQPKGPPGPWCLILADKRQSTMYAFLFIPDPSWTWYTIERVIWSGNEVEKLDGIIEHMAVGKNHKSQVKQIVGFLLNHQHTETARVPSKMWCGTAIRALVRAKLLNQEGKKFEGVKEALGLEEPQAEAPGEEQEAEEEAEEGEEQFVSDSDDDDAPAQTNPVPQGRPARAPAARPRAARATAPTAQRGPAPATAPAPQMSSPYVGMSLEDFDAWLAANGWRPPYHF